MCACACVGARESVHVCVCACTCAYALGVRGLSSPLEWKVYHRGNEAANTSDIHVLTTRKTEKSLLLSSCSLKAASVRQLVVYRENILKTV